MTRLPIVADDRDTWGDILNEFLLVAHNADGSLIAGPSSTGTATFLVAANDALASTKSRADYVCDGTADQVQIQEAIDDLPSTGGKVVLSEGDFFCSAPVNIDKNGVWLQGSGAPVNASTGGADTTGKGTRLRVVSGFTETDTNPAVLILVNGGDSTKYLAGCHVSDLTIDGISRTGTDIRGIYAETFNCILNNLNVIACSGGGIEFKGANDGTNASFKAINNVVYCVQCWFNDVAGIYFNTFAPDNHVFGCQFFSNTHGIRVNAGSLQFTDCHTYANGSSTAPDAGHNVFIEASNRTKIVNLKCETAGEAGIFLDGGIDTQIIGCNFRSSSQNTTNTNSDIEFSASGSTSSRTVIVGCNFEGDSSGNHPKHAILLNNRAADVVIKDNVFAPSSQYGTSAFPLGTLATGEIEGGPNYKLEAVGRTASVADGGTISHGLAGTPSVVVATPETGGEMVSVTARGASTFTVAIKKHDNTAGTSQTIYWHAKVWATSTG